MTRDQIQMAINEGIPFEIKMADGAKYRVRARYQVAVGRTSVVVIVEKCPETGFYVGYIPGFRGAHSQASSLDELKQNLEEVVGMLLEDGEPSLHGECVGTQKIEVA